VAAHWLGGSPGQDSAVALEMGCCLGSYGCTTKGQAQGLPLRMDLADGDQLDRGVQTVVGLNPSLPACFVALLRLCDIDGLLQLR
jgi:hypothetical protein